MYANLKMKSLWEIGGLSWRNFRLWQDKLMILLTYKTSIVEARGKYPNLTNFGNEFIRIKKKLTAHKVIVTQI